MKFLIAVLRKLLNLKRDVDTIMSPLTKIVEELEKHAQEQTDKALRAEAEAKAALEKAGASAKESTRAKAAAQRVADFAKV